MTIPITIIVDTREQQPFTFASFPNITVIRKKLDTGDYSIEGYEDKISIDKKKNLAEIVLNLKEQRFERELARMQAFEACFFVCCFPFSRFAQYPSKSGIPKSRWPKLREGGMTILNKVRKLEMDYGIPFIYCADRYTAERKVIEIFTRFLEEKQNE